MTYAEKLRKVLRSMKNPKNARRFFGTEFPEAEKLLEKSADRTPGE